MNRPLLHAIDMNFAAGQVIGITGPSGVGKSTLANLLRGGETPSQGNVLFEFEDGKSIDVDRLIYPIDHMPEKNQLIDGSIRENIALHGTDDLADAHKVARFVGISDQIMSLPNKFETRDTPLPAGMVQMIFLARALYTNAPVLVLDHPENTLDSQLKARLLQTLLKLKASHKTIILFTQSKSLLDVADQRFVLRNGSLHPFNNAIQEVTAIPSASRIGQTS